MPADTRIEIQEMHEGENTWSDFTPTDRRIFARTLSVKVAKAKDARQLSVTVTEADKNDPSILDLCVFVGDPKQPGGGDEFVVSMMTAAELDRLIDALTVARDKAIAEFMIEPAKGVAQA